ncbi:SNF5 like protein [Cryptosporidium felis]|nr:SNF5 like protein [Cryptosporidium felis]
MVKKGIVSKSEKKLIFDDPLVENLQFDFITHSDIKRITNKTFDFLRNTGLRQTHISAVTGINQSILSIILRDPGTKSISINRKKDVIQKLCEYYNKINLGLVSHDPLTAPKISTSKKSSNTIQKKRILPKRNAIFETETSNTDFRSATRIEDCEDHFSNQAINSDQERRGNTEEANLNSDLTEKNNGTNTIYGTSIENPAYDTLTGFNRNVFLFSSCINCRANHVEEEYINYHIFEKINNSPVSAIFNFTSVKSIDFMTPNQVRVGDFEKNSISKNQLPFLIPLSINLRHFISSSFLDNSGCDFNNSSLRSNPSAIFSTLKNKNYKAERFVWSSASEPNSIWSYIENLTRERHLSSFMTTSDKKRAFNWLLKEIENYKSIYMEFLYVIMKFDVIPENNPLLIREIYLNESYEDIVFSDKFKWNISASTSLLKGQIECIVSDLNLPNEMFPGLLYCSLKQVFDEIVLIVGKFDDSTGLNRYNPIDTSAFEESGRMEDEMSSNHSFGANTETRTNRYFSEESTKPVSFGKLLEWGDHADLEYDSDDNIKLYPIIENAEEKRQIENRNRFRKRR